MSSSHLKHEQSPVFLLKSQQPHPVNVRSVSSPFWEYKLIIYSVLLKNKTGSGNLHHLKEVTWDTVVSNASSFSCQSRSHCLFTVSRTMLVIILSELLQSLILTKWGWMLWMFLHLMVSGKYNTSDFVLQLCCCETDPKLSFKTKDKVFILVIHSV